jgi:chromosome segregation ATPase
MAISRELEEQLKKAKEKSRDRLKRIKELEEDLKEERLHNKFLTKRLGDWADRNFIIRQEIENMTVDKVLAKAKTKEEFRQLQKTQELAEAVDKAREGASKLDTSGLANQGKEK